MARIGFGAAALLLLAACGSPPPQDYSHPLLAIPVGQQDAVPLPLAYQRGVERATSEAPFQRGALAVVAREGGFVETFDLVPCQGGRAICAGSDRGPAGTLARTPDWFVVRGLYGRTFWLSYGGDGYVQRGNVLWSLAWSARADGRGEGPGPQPATGSEVGVGATLETNAPHR